MNPEKYDDQVYEELGLNGSIEDYNDYVKRMPKVSKSVWRGLVSVLAFLTPVVFAHFPEYMNLTIGGLLNAVLHYAEKTVTNL